MNRVRFLSKIVLAACLSLALVLTCSCSSDDGNSGGNSGSEATTVFCQTANACVAVSAEACLDLGGSKVTNCEVASPSSSSSVGEQGSSSSEDRGCSIQGYKTVEIGTQTWMAENLNCVGEDAVNPVGACYNSAPLNCNIYGRLYDWSTAKWICPPGWHLPTDAEWDILVNYAGGSDAAGTKLKAKSGWGNSISGTDNYGFSALPGGYNVRNNFSGISSSGMWWTATESAISNSVYYKRMSSDNGGVATGVANGEDGSATRSFLSVRCLKDQQQIQEEAK